MNLFQLGEFKLASGDVSLFKIECDALTPDDWEALAFMAVEKLGGSFGMVSGVPRGGIPFANALKKYIAKESDYILFVDDVLTTGKSLSDWVDTVRRDLGDGCPAGIRGACVFARGPVPWWVTPLFRMEG